MPIEKRGQKRAIIPAILRGILEIIWTAERMSLAERCWKGGARSGQHRVTETQRHREEHFTLSRIRSISVPQPGNLRRMVAAVMGVECEGFIESNFSLIVRMEVSPLEVARRQSSKEQCPAGM